MMQPLFESSAIPLLEKVAAFGERRHDVIAGNIANVDTPNYKTRDLPVQKFQEALRAAVERMHNSSSPAASVAANPLSGPASNSRSAPATIEQLFPEELFQASDASPRNLTFQDANNRSIESEFMEMTKNNMMQNFAVELMQAQMNMLQAVIQERA